MSVTFYSALASAAASWRIGSFQQLPSVPVPILAGPASSFAIRGISVGEKEIMWLSDQGIECMQKMASKDSQRGQTSAAFSSPNRRVEIHLGNPARLTTQFSERSAFKFSGNVNFNFSEMIATPWLEYQLDLQVGAARVFRMGNIGNNGVVHDVLHMSAHFHELKRFGLLQGSIYPELGVSREEFEEMGVRGFIESYLQYASRVHGWNEKKALEESGITHKGFVVLPAHRENPELAFLWKTMDAVVKSLDAELERRGRYL